MAPNTHSDLQFHVRCPGRFMRLVVLALAVPLTVLNAAHAERAGTVEQKPRDLYATALPFCRMMAERTKYVGTEIAVSGLYASTPHGGMIYGRECPNAAIFLSGAAGQWISPQAEAVFADVYRGDRVVHVPVVILAVLRATPAVTPCSSDSCMRYSLERAQTIVALPDVVVR